MWGQKDVTRSHNVDKTCLNFNAHFGRIELLDNYVLQTATNVGQHTKNEHINSENWMA